MSTQRLQNLFFVDVEATTRSPMTGVMTELGAVHYATRETHYVRLWDTVPHPDNPAIPLVKSGGTHYDEAKLLTQFATWVDFLDEHGRPVFISDNNGYDAMWVTCYLDKHGIDNPFGHSSRRIGDIYAGLRKTVNRTGDWKRWRVTEHTHNPVDDAMGNVEAFERMLAELL